MRNDVTVEQIERLARLQHETYLRSSPNPNGEESARCGWDALAERFKESNRDAVRHKLDELTLLGYVVVAETSCVGRARFCVDDHLETLAQREHNRWIDFMIEAGYSVGSHRRDDPPSKGHPDLVPWNELSEETQEKDRAPWRDFIEHLAQVDLAVVSLNTSA